MNLQFEISKRLSREHQEVTALLTRLEKFLLAVGPGGQPDWGAGDTRRILGEFKGALATEIPNHFAIEELELFPLYDQEEGGEMVEMLLADHKVILDLAADIQPLVAKALSRPEGLDQGEWEMLRAKGNVFATELTAHADKEEFGFVLAVDELLDPATAARIQNRYLQM